MNSTSRLARLIRLAHVRDRKARADFAVATARLLRNRRVRARLQSLQASSGCEGPSMNGAMFGATMEFDGKISAEVVKLASDIRIAVLLQGEAGGAVMQARRALDAANTLYRDEIRTAASRLESRTSNICGEHSD